MWILPTRNRLSSVARLFRSFREMGVTTPGLVLVNLEELVQRKREYDALDLPNNWEVVGVKANSMHDALRAIFDRVKDCEVVGLLQDDLVPATPSWDANLFRSVQGHNVVSANDGNATNRMHGAIVWSGALLRALGWFYPPGLNHQFGDDVWETLGRETGCWQIRQDVVTKHLNETYSSNGDGTADHIRKNWDNDKAVYEKWLAEDKAECIKKIRAVQEAHGVMFYQPDFTGVSVMLGTPTLDGKYESAYMTSLFKTLQFFSSVGVRCDVAEEKYNADISLARAKVIAAFLRSNCTHLLMIDADMGWEVDAVIRLFAAKKDFVAVAGPKKSYPLRFAANFTDDSGDMIPLQIERASGAAEIGEVGMAFALITRQVAAKMATSYPELAYRGITGEVEHGLFMPMIARGQYMAEDFAFCVRWRMLGGKLFICPDVKLSHTGSHRFEGSLAESFQKPIEPVKYMQLSAAAE